MKRVCLGYWDIPLFAMRNDKAGMGYACVSLNDNEFSFLASEEYESGSRQSCM